ncbi:MAG TPA: peptide deformylase [Thermoanaerobaculia bacterium]|nr:peptide deformylase [Thermoanaerobaculia bacterium]
MPARPIVRLGHPALRTPASAVPPPQIGTAGIQELIDDMVETMRAAEGVGLAAPQVGVELQLFVYEVRREDGEPVPLRVVINPMLAPLAGELVYDWEGCLSIPGLRGLVPRHQRVRVRGFDRGGAAIDYVADGFEARIVEHEFDHLNGVVFLDRMRDLRSLAYAEEWAEFLAGDEETAAISEIG